MNSKMHWEQVYATKKPEQMGWYESHLTSSLALTCSGLPVVRYSPAQLHDELGKELILEEHRRERHLTPGGVAQQYLYCRFRRPA